MALNVKLLRRVRDAIKNEPAQFVMGSWFTRELTIQTYISAYSLPAAGSLRTIGDMNREIPNCGTAACIAGWTLSLAARKTPQKTASSASNSDILTMAEIRLGLQPDDESLSLFILTEWPRAYLEAWNEASTLEERAQVAAKRIDAFIKSYQDRQRRRRAKRGQKGR